VTGNRPTGAVQPIQQQQQQQQQRRSSLPHHAHVDPNAILDMTGSGAGRGGGGGGSHSRYFCKQFFKQSD